MLKEEDKLGSIACVAVVRSVLFRCCTRSNFEIDLPSPKINPST